MMRALLNWMAGYRKIRIAPESGASGLSLLQKCPYVHWGLRTKADGSISVYFLDKDALSFLHNCEAHRIAAEAERTRGFPYYRRKYAKRWGVPLGFVLFFLIVYASSAVVWSVEISGNEKFSDEEIVLMLRSSGFGEGTSYGSIDFELFQNDFPLNHPGISWIAVNMLGNKAFVEVRESNAQDSEEKQGASNVIAAEDGQIAEILVAGGRPEVSPLQVVRKGELLISGIMNIQEGKLRFERASGQVLARVYRTIQAEIPFQQNVKEYTGAECVEKSLIFFGKTLKFFQKGGFEGGSYDTIIENIPWILPGGIHLPIQLNIRIAREYSMNTITLSERQAHEAAIREFEKLLAELLETAEILTLEYETTADENFYRIKGKAECLADIAETKEISRRSS